MWSLAAIIIFFEFVLASSSIWSVPFKTTRDLGRKSWGSKHIKEKELAGYDSLQSNNIILRHVNYDSCTLKKAWNILKYKAAT